MGSRALLLALLALFALAHPRSLRAQDPAGAARAAAAIPTAHERIPVWVFFDDPASRSWRAEQTGARALPPEWLDRIRRTGATIRHESLWLGAVSVDAGAEQVETLGRLAGVARIQPVRRFRAASAVPDLATARWREDARSASRESAAGAADGGGATILAAGGDPELYGLAYGPLAELGVPEAHALGFDGRGIRVAVLGSGFDRSHESLSPLTVTASRNFVHGGTDVSSRPDESLDAERHGTWVWSLAAGAAPGRFMGPAHGASFMLVKVNEILTDSHADEDRWVAGLEWAVNNGARLILSTVSFRGFDDGFRYDHEDLDGDVAIMSIAADEAARRGALVVTEVGDGGSLSGSLYVPADADSVLSVGAADSTGARASFSGRGPTADGRIKPELVARGANIFAAAARDEDGYDRLQPGSTSLSTGVVGGLAALVMEAWPQLGPMAIRRALMESGDNVQQPDNSIGWGRPDVAYALLFPEGIQDLGSEDLSADGAFISVAPRFSWSVPRTHPVAGTVRYHVELSASRDFREILYASQPTTQRNLRVNSALRPARRVYWRVVAETEGGLRRASPAQGPVDMPSWVTLRSPNSSSGSFISALRPRLIWSPIEAPAPIGPLEYDVEVISVKTGQVVQRVNSVRDSTTLVPEPLAYNSAYRWRVIARARDGAAADTVESSGPFVIVSPDRPPATLLYQNFPNPFPSDVARETAIWFDLDAPARVDLAVFDLRGRLVRQLIPAPGCENGILAPGLYGRPGIGGGDPCLLTEWDGRDGNGSTVARGVYLLRLRANGFEQVRRMLFVGEGR